MRKGDVMRMRDWLFEDVLMPRATLLLACVACAVLGLVIGLTIVATSGV